MIYRRIPGTDLSVSLLGFGNFTFGTNWWGNFSDHDAVRLQNGAVDLGVNFFDSAPAYGDGRAEKLLAETIDYASRDQLVISTKFGYDLPDDPGPANSHRERRQDFSGSFIRSDLEQSLKRLRIDCIDLYQAHNLKLPQFTDELFETLQRLSDQGKIRAWGVALGPAIGWREEGYEALIKRDAATVQTVFNLYEQDPGREFCRIAARRRRGGVIARVPTNSGILDEEFTSPDHTFPDRDHRKFRDRNWLVYGLKKNQIIRPLAEQLGVSLRQLAFRWLASQDGLISIEPNLTTDRDLHQFVAACDAGDLALPGDMLGQLDELYQGDFCLGDEAHPCDLKSSTAPESSIRSGYLEPALGT